MFPLAHFTVDLVETNIKHCDMKFVTRTFSPPSLLKNTVQTVYILKKYKPLVKPESSGDQHPKDHHHDLSGRISGDGTFHHHQLIC